MNNYRNSRKNRFRSNGDRGFRKRSRNTCENSTKIPPIFLFFILYSPILLLYAFGHDWGRWVHIQYSMSILLYLYFVKHKTISENLNDNFYINFLIKRKKFLIVVFFIFAFYWNPKTLITGDIATNSLYKIVYNSSKIIVD